MTAQDGTFRFALEPLLTHRIHLEEQKQRELAVALGRLEREETKRKTLEEHISKITQEYRETATGCFLPAEREIWHRYLDKKRKEIKALSRRVALFRQHVELARKNLVAARKMRRMMEKLKEKKRTVYAEEMHRRELVFANEMAAQRFIRNHLAES